MTDRIRSTPHRTTPPVSRTSVSRVSEETANVLGPKALRELAAFVEARVDKSVRVSVTDSRTRGQQELHMEAVGKNGEVLLSAVRKFPELPRATAELPESRQPAFGSQSYAFGALDHLLAFSEGIKNDPKALVAALMKTSPGGYFNEQGLEVTGGSLYREGLRGWGAR